MPFVWPVPGLRADVPPADIDGLLGFYSMDAGATFVAGTWEAVKASHDVALTAAALVRGGERAAFALCRPPGHHAGPRFAGGYCFVNNAAVAAEWLRRRGRARVSVLDIDYHHGNGTQAIFYDRGRRAGGEHPCRPAGRVSLFPRPCRRARRRRGRGRQPEPAAAARHRFRRLVGGARTGCAAVAAFAPAALVVSLGVDTYRGDPISRFRLDTADYPVIGARIAALGLPTLFVMEGGYAVEAIGVNAVGVLEGFERG